jgi:hypothetical protein
LKPSAFRKFRVIAVSPGGVGTERFTAMLWRINLAPVEPETVLRA